MCLRFICLFLIAPCLLAAQSLNAFSRLTPAILAAHHISRISVCGSYRSDHSPFLPLSYELNRDGYPVSYPEPYEQATCHVERKTDNRPTFMYYTYNDRPGKDTFFLMQYVYNDDGKLSKIYDFFAGKITTVNYDSQGRAAQISGYRTLETDPRKFKAHRPEARRLLDSMNLPGCRIYTEKIKYKKGKVRIIDCAWSTRRYTIPDSLFHIDHRIAGDLLQSVLPWYDDDYSPGCNISKILNEDETATQKECFTRLNRQQQVIEKVFYDNTPRPNEPASRKSRWLISYDGDLPQKIILQRTADDKEESSIDYEIRYEYFR